MSPEERQQKIRELAKQLAPQFRAHRPAPGADINELEDFVAEIGYAVQRELAEDLLNEEASRKEGNRTACPCGNSATFQRFHALRVLTSLGLVTVRRAYYRCGQCGAGHCPADARFRLGPSNTTPRVQAQIAAMGALVPYGQVGTLCRQLGLPYRLDLKTGERITQGVGNALAAEPPVPFGPAERPVVIGFDGVMIRTPAGKKEVRVGVVYEPDPDAEETPSGNPRRTAATAGDLRKEYLATTGSRASLVAATGARARARAGDRPVAVVADGAALDWSELDPVLPERVEILDFRHTQERLGEIAKVMHRAPGAAQAWQEFYSWWVGRIGPEGLLRELRAWKPETEVAQEVRRVQLAYFERQQGRMQYPDYREAGYPIGSGAVEGTCRHVVVDRFRQSGMRWQLGTAEPVLQLRAALLTHGELDLRGYTVTKSRPSIATAA
jgi:hypothetical protein